MAGQELQGMNHYISLGAGVQSSTMALMAACGEITPMPNAAIFADTQGEPAEVYDWLDWLEKQLPFPVYRATFGDLAKDALRIRRSSKSGKLYSKALIPLFTKNPDGSKGILQRQCTRDYKVNVINRKIKELLGVKAARRSAGVMAVTWVGISRDEIIRIKPSHEPWIENRWPLIERNATRQECLRWMERHNYPRPPRSACVFCPYHSDAEWFRLKTEHPDEFAKAVAFEKAFQEVAVRQETMTGTPFLHDSLVQLDKINFDPDRRQQSLFGNECEGMCGV